MLSPDTFNPLGFDQELAPLPQYKAPRDTALDFGGLLARPLELHEDLTAGCGGQTWPAGVVLARHVLRYHRHDFGDARILEIGAGGGLVGLAVASGCDVRQQHPVHVTDQVDMMALMRHNISLNGLEGRVKPLVLNWGEALPAEVVQFRPDVILAADCVYLEAAFPLLLRTLADLLVLCPSATVYFCFMKRRRADMHFIRAARKRFAVAELPDEDRAVFSREGLFLYAFTSKTSKEKNSTTNDGDHQSNGVVSS